MRSAVTSRIDPGTLSTRVSLAPGSTRIVRVWMACTVLQPEQAFHDAVNTNWISDPCCAANEGVASTAPVPDARLGALGGSKLERTVIVQVPPLATTQFARSRAA